MSTATVPAGVGEALGMLESAMGFLADADAAEMPTEALAECLRVLEQADAVEAVARGQFLVAFDAKGGHLADGQRTCRTWLIHSHRSAPRWCRPCWMRWPPPRAARTTGPVRSGGRTSLTNLKDYCWWHHHVVLHQMGWTLTVHPDGTSQVRSPTGKTIRSHSPPPRPG